MDVSCELEIYPSVPRPRVVEVRLVPPAFDKRKAVVDIRDAVET